MITSYKNEIYDQDLLPLGYPQVVSAFETEFINRGLSFNDFEFSEFLLSHDDTFFLSYYNKHNEEQTATLEGNLGDLTDTDFEVAED